MDGKSQRVLVAASVAGLLAAAGSVVRTAHAQETMTGGGSEGMVSCYVPSSCSGKGDCGGKGHSCAGQNGCEGKGYVKLELDENTCLRIQGGRLTAAEPTA